MDTRIYVVEFTKFAAKQIQRVPKPIQEAVFLWKEAVEKLGLPEVMKAKGYHDEPLKGQRKGQRSIRLNRAYRLIYTRDDQKEVTVVGVQEVNKHEY